MTSKFFHQATIILLLRVVSRVTDDTPMTQSETWWPLFSRRHFQIHVLMGPFNNIPPLVQLWVLRRRGDKPLSEAMMPLFADAYMCHSDSVSWYSGLYRARYIIQIKICAEYRDMLPRPRLVCQEPGPIGRPKPMCAWQIQPRPG